MSINSHIRIIVTTRAVARTRFVLSDPNCCTSSPPPPFSFFYKSHLTLVFVYFLLIYASDKKEPEIPILRTIPTHLGCEMWAQL